LRLSERFFILLRTISIYLNTHFLLPFFKILCANVQKASASGGLRPQTPYQYFAPRPHWETSVPNLLIGHCLFWASLGEFLLQKIRNLPKNSTRPKNQRHEVMAGWHWQNFDPDLPLRFKLHEIRSVDSQKIIKIVATRCQILRLKCTKFDFGWGSVPDPAGGAYSASQTS